MGWIFISFGLNRVNDFLSAVTKGLHEGARTQSGFIILVKFAMIVHLFLNTSVCAVNLIDESIKCGNIEL